MANTTPKADIVLGGTKGKLVRFSHLHVHEPKMNTESGKLEYSIAVLIPKGNVEDVTAIKSAVRALAKQTWLDDGKKLPPNFWNPLKDGDTDTKQDGSEYGQEVKGHHLLNVKASEDYPPNVVGTARDAKGQFVVLGKREMKSGDWGRVKITLKPYTKGNGGVGAYFTSVQLVQQGEPLGSVSSAESDFRDFEDDDEPSDLDMLK